MKSKDVAQHYGFNLYQFDQWLRSSGYKVKSGFLGDLVIDDSHDLNEIVRVYKEELERIHLQSVEDAAAKKVMQQELSSMLITSGFSFDGYTITRYSGYISGDDAVEIPRGQGGFFGGNVTNVADSLMNSLVHIRRNALTELKEAAYALGCNAVIGVDFDYITLDPETVGSNGGTLYLPYVFGVTANGNAVYIEKNA